MNEFTDPLDRLLADVASPAAIRAIERGGPITALWQALESSGFPDAMVPEAQGGAGLPLSAAFDLFVMEGRHGAPAPLAHTMVARAVLARAGAEIPAGSIAIAPATATAEDPSGPVTCRNTPWGLVADWVIASLRGRWLVLPTSTARREATGVHASLRADLHWDALSGAAFASFEDTPWLEAGAAIAAAHIAGAMERTLAMTLQFANDRTQFGRSIGKFQAIQHQLAVMAEHVAAGRMGAEIGCHAPGPLPAPLRAAAAKARASEAAALVAPMAHAVHGAIGVTAELDLQLFTRRLHEWRADFGSERAWNLALGRALLAGDDPALDFMRDALLPK